MCLFVEVLNAVGAVDYQHRPVYVVQEPGGHL